MQIEHEIFFIESQLQGISPLLEGILFYGEVRSKVMALLSAESQKKNKSQCFCSVSTVKRD